MKILLYCYSLTAILCFSTTKGDTPTQNCEYGVNKCPGYFQFSNGHIISSDPPVDNLPLVGTHKCETACAANAECWFIEHRDSQCILFSKNSRIQIENPMRMIFWWNCCPDPGTCRSENHRCFGFWMTRNDVYWTGPLVLQTITKIQDSMKCRQACISNPLCAAVNLRDSSSDGSLINGYCELLKFDASSPNQTSDSSSLVLQWHCCRYNDGDLPKAYRRQDGKCFGRWEVSREPQQMYNDSIEQFFTMSKLDCMTACDSNPFCVSVFFNQAAALCVLRGKNPNPLNSCKNFDSVNISDSSWQSWHGYKWRCKNRNESPLQPYDNEPVHFEAQCVCLNASVIGLFELATDGCIEPLSEHVVTLNSSMAAFWLRERTQVTRSGKQWTRVFNGELYLWVSKPLSELELCPKHRCDVYSTVIDEEAPCPPVVKRSQWHALPYKGNKTYFVTLPEFAIILNSACPESGCFSYVSCRAYVRQFQAFHQNFLKDDDIAYNFVVGGDGSIFEGRGADVVGAHTKYYNFASIGIAIIGWFEDHTPSIKSLRATRQLIRCLMLHSNLSHTYQLKAHRDLRPSTIPGRQLYELLPSWPHYSKTILPPGPACGPIFARRRRQLIELISVSVGSGLLLIVLALLYAFIFRHASWCPLRQSRFRSNKRHRFSNILCNVGSHAAFHKHMHLWPPNCIVRKSATLQIHPLSTRLLVLTERKSQSCGCLRLITLLWARCLRESLFEFPSLLSNSLVMKRCRCYRVLFWREAVYVLHVERLSIARKVIRKLQESCCICYQDLVTVHPVMPPSRSLDGDAEFEADRNPFDVNCILEQRLHRFESLDSFCRIYQAIGGNPKEMTYDEFCNNIKEEQTVIYEFSENEQSSEEENVE